VELDEKEAELIRQVNAKEIDESQFWELVAELDLERVMGESVANGLAMTQEPHRMRMLARVSRMSQWGRKSPKRQR
jgi:hypothetical protein